MNDEERIDLLTRLDERTLNIWRSVDKLERHQSEENGMLRTIAQDVVENTAWRRTSKWLLGLGISTIVAVIIMLIEIAKGVN